MKFYIIKNNPGLYIDSLKLSGYLSTGHIWMKSLTDNFDKIYVRQDVTQIEKKDMNEAQKALLVSARLKGLI